MFIILLKVFILSIFFFFVKNCDLKREVLLVPLVYKCVFEVVFFRRVGVWLVGWLFFKTKLDFKPV